MKKMYKYLFVLPLLFLTFAMHAKEETLTSHLDSIVLGSGCFWGAEKGYEQIDGVENAVSGYSDGFGTVSYTHLRAHET